MEETELRLGLPGGGGGEAEAGKNCGKRGFAETIDLKLQLQTPADAEEAAVEAAETMKRSLSHKKVVSCGSDPEKPPAPKYVSPSRFLACSTPADMFLLS